MSRPRVAFLGLGTMGFPMAGHLPAAGFDVCVYNRSEAKARAWEQQFGGSRTATAREAASDADYVCVCVGNDDDVRAVLYGDQGALAACKPGSVVIDHTTTSASLALELARAADSRGAGFLDAPVSGGQQGAINGQLTCMVGGTPETFERARPVLQAYTRCLELIGSHGSGQLAKMVNQICIGGLLQGLAEALHFGKCAGLDMDKVLKVLSQGAAQSWQMEHRGRTMLAGQFDFGFAVRWMLKDLGICLEQADSLGLRLPVTELVEQLYQRVQQRGGERWDTSSLITLLADPP